MDPDETLRIIRALAAQIPVEENDYRSQGVYRQHVRDLCEHVEALDTWLRGGGFPPADWMTEIQEV